LERDGFIKGVVAERKRVYALTDKGEQNIKIITKAYKELQDFIEGNKNSMDNPKQGSAN